MLIAFKLASVANKRRFGGQSQHFGLSGHPIVVHSLGVFGVSHQSRHKKTAINFKFVTNNANHRDPLACPVVFLQHFVAVSLAPLDPLAVHLAALERNKPGRLEHGVFAGSFKRGAVVRVQVKLGGLVFDVKVLRNADHVLVQPIGQVFVANALLLDRRDGHGVWEKPGVLRTREIFCDKAPFGVRSAWILNGGVHVDTKRVANAPDADVLIERVIAAILRQQSDVALAVGYLILASSIVSHVRVRHILNMAHDTIIDFSDFHVRLVIDRDDLAAWAILSLIICYLAHMLGQLVDGQARPSIDRLPLHRSTGSQHVRRPLPLVVGRTCKEPQVV